MATLCGNTQCYTLPLSGELMAIFKCKRWVLTCTSPNVAWSYTCRDDGVIYSVRKVTLQAYVG